jgi:hypothetical protein
VCVCVCVCVCVPVCCSGGGVFCVLCGSTTKYRYFRTIITPMWISDNYVDEVTRDT